MKAVVFSAVLILVSAAAVHAQAVSLDDAVVRCARDIERELAQGAIVAVLNFESASPRFSNYVLDEMGKVLVRGGKVTVVERARLDRVHREMDFQTSGHVDDNSVQSIGKMLGAQSVISGSVEDMGSFYLIRFITIEVGSARVQVSSSADVRKDARVAALTGDADAKKGYRSESEAVKMNSIGVSAGSAFSAPFLTLTLRGTITPARNSFLEIGMDAGLFSRYENSGYFSVFPYIHYNFFLPVSKSGKSGWYIGLGAGYMYARYSFDENSPEHRYLSVESEEFHFISGNAVTGFIIADALDISYTLRTDFKTVNNKLSVGYIYRFGKNK